MLFLVLHKIKKNIEKNQIKKHKSYFKTMTDPGEKPEK